MQTLIPLLCIHLSLFNLNRQMCLNLKLFHFDNVLGKHLWPHQMTLSGSYFKTEKEDTLSSFKKYRNFGAKVQVKDSECCV